MNEANQDPIPTQIETQPNQEQRRVFLQQETIEFTSPIPHPELLKRYEEIQEGLADRIIAMTEKEQNHRIKIDEKLIDNDYKRSFTGLIAGFLIAIAGLGGSVYLGAIGKTWASGIISTGTLGSLVTIFVKGTNGKNKDEN